MQGRLYRSLKLWSFYCDLEESLGTPESTKAVYAAILELRIATPQIVLNYAEFLRVPAWPAVWELMYCMCATPFHRDVCLLQSTPGLWLSGAASVLCGVRLQIAPGMQGLCGLGCCRPTLA